MYRFIESIKFNNGEFENLELHQDRINRTSKAFFNKISVSLKSLDFSPPLDNGLYKFRLVYSETDFEYEFVAYSPWIIKTLRVVNSEPFDYKYKYEDRSILEILTSGLDNNEDIIICIDNKILDSSYSNIALLKNGKWYTPSSPLLEGIKRKELINSGSLIPKSISLDSLFDYERISLINAMLNLDEVSIDITDVVD